MCCSRQKRITHQPLHRLACTALPYELQSLLARLLDHSSHSFSACKPDHAVCSAAFTTMSPLLHGSRAAQMMGDTSFLSALVNFPKEGITDETVELLKPYFRAPDFNFESAKKVGLLLLMVLLASPYSR